MKKQHKQDKTNAMRLLDQAEIPYETGEYEYDESDLSGDHVAEYLGISPDIVFKTLVTVGHDKNHYVFVIPSSGHLDLKKAAKAAKVKNIEMIAVKELLPLTGYIRGGCSPIGMKKPFPTFIDETAVLFDAIYISAGKRGSQIIVNAEDLAAYIGASFEDLTEE